MITKQGNVVWLRLAGAAFAAALLCAVLFGSLTMPGQASESDCSTIQCMIDNANPGETVIVPAGIYNESLILTKPVSVTGVSSATVIVRAPANQRVMVITGTAVTNAVLIAGMTFENGNTPENGGGVYIGGGAQPRFEDMTFTNNTARYRGGAIFMDSPGGTLIVRRSRFTGNQVDYNNDDNTRGAAVAVSGADSRLILESVQMTGNTSERYGGAIAIEGNVNPAHLAITDSLINNNTASELDGGAIFGSLAVITVTRSTLDNNRAPANDRLGGAVYLTGVGARLTLIGSTFSNNQGYRQGGAIYANGNDIQINVLDGSILTGNSTADNDTYAYGGAIYLFGNRAALTISASTVSANTSVNYGGAIFIDGDSDTDQARLTITDSQINNNEATLYNGGGIWADQTLVSITNSTVDGNRAPAASRVGGGIYLTGLNTALTLDRSSVSRNLVGRTGAGIYASGNTIQMVVRNGSVIDGNESTEDNDGAQGGGIYLSGTGVRLDVADSSISNNIAERFGGGVYFYNNSSTIFGQLTVSRSQINNNEATDRSGGGLYVYQSAVTITQSTLNDNRALDTSGDWAGGALYMGGAGSNLTLTDSTVARNTAAAYGGGIYLSNTTAKVIIANSVISGNVTLRDVTANTGGGGLYLSAAGDSRLTISDSVFANNRAQWAGGALFYYGATTSVFSVTDSQFTGNQAVTNNGGGLYIRQAATTLTRVTVSGNTANGVGGDGGGIYLEGSGAASTFDPIEVINNTANDLGGGIYAGSTLTLRNATVRGNSTNNRGGGIYAAGGTLTINDSTLAQNATYVAADGDGGAIYTAVNLTLNNTWVISNTANDDGGGIYGSAGTVTLNDSTLNGNATGSGADADADGGALYVNGNTTLTRVTVRGNTANRYGGGIYRNGGDVTLDRSTLAGNTSGSSGGALYMAGGELTTANSTFSGNRTLNAGGDGGALWVNTNATLYNTTIFNNTAAGLGGGIRRLNTGSIVFRNSLVVGNSPSNCSGTMGITGVSNLADDATCGINFTYNPNAARLGPLADNGGPTWTHLLRPGNPAFNAGDLATCGATPVNGIDQRGVARPQGAQCDIGAVEATATLVLTKSSANEGGDPLRPGERITYTLLLVNESPLGNTGVVITDAVPAHTTFIPGSLTVQPPSAGGTPGVQPVLVSNLTVAAGSVVTVTFAVTADLALNRGDVIVNTASARSDQVSQPVSATVTDTVITPAVLYAAPSVIGSGDCSSWANACLLRTALASAFAGDEIWVKAGAHYPTTAPNDRTAAFTLKNGVALYGGFAGTETSRSQRDWQANKTILSGDIDRNDINTDGNFIAETWDDLQGNNAYHVVTSSGTDATAVLDGFVITAGQANEYFTSNGYGGGMYNAGGSPTLLNITFSGNTAFENGGGMYSYDGAPTLTNVAFNGNSATLGGGIDNVFGNPTLAHVTFSGNQGYYGGGMFSEWSNPTLTNVTFSGNQASAGGGMATGGGNSTLTNVIFSGNTASSSGGGMLNDSGSTLTNVTFSGNAAGVDGGGMYNNNNNSTLTRVTFSGNAADYGGGMYNYYGAPTLTNVTFSGNTAGLDGGGMYNYSPGGSGDPTLLNVTFSGNSANESGGGMYNDWSNPTLVNAILWGNSASTGPEIYNDSSTLTISTSDIQGCGGSGAGWQAACGADGGGNIDADPRFVDAANSNLRLDFGSPAIDAGTNSGCPSTDLDGLPRPTDGNGDGTATCDMGAYEAGTMLCSAPYTFNEQSGVAVNITAPGNLVCVYVDEMRLNHPAATTGLQTGRYWFIRGLQGDKQSDASGFTVTLTLPTTFTPAANDKVCRYTGSGQVWDCAMSSYTSNSITRSGITAFSDWTIGRNVGPTALQVQAVRTRPTVPWAALGSLLLACALYRRRR